MRHLLRSMCTPLGATTIFLALSIGAGFVAQVIIIHAPAIFGAFV